MSSKGGRMSSLSVVRPWRVVIALGLVAAGLIASGGARASALTCQSVQTPNLGSPRIVELLGVSVTSSRNGWAVGYVRKSEGYPARTLIERWNGTAWTVQTSPNPGSGDSRLSGVAATSSTNAWAVGYDRHGALIEHWNGRAWKVQPSPKLRYSGLSGVAAISSTNVWAVGLEGNETALIEHWNGRAWKVQPSPKLRFRLLTGVAATSSRNAWAVGSDTNSKTLIEHWNGKVWKVQASPNPVFFQDQKDATMQLSGVAATSPTNAWAVGYTNYVISPDQGDESHGFIEHWNGRAWKVQASPKLRYSGLSGVAAISSTNVWAVGGYYNVGSGKFQTLVERWNGGAWTRLPSLGGYSELSGVAATSSTNVWAVGDDYGSAAIALHCG